MPQPPSITLDPAPHPALSYAGLRAEALELLGRLCGERWSDFNSHDPGITILEQLCYALTELAWRCQWPIADLLATADGDWQPTAEQILHGDPVTRDDLLALLRALGCQAVVLEGADQPDLPLYFRPTTVARALPAAAAGPPVAGDLELDATLVAGLAATPPEPVVPHGVWRVAAQLGSGAPGQGPASLQPIARRLHGVRLLGRDFSLEALTPFEVVVKAELELVAPEVPPDLPARLRDRLDAVISAVDAAAEPGGLRGAHLIQSLQGLPEVRRVIALSLASSPAGPFHPWHLPLPGRGARLHPASPIAFSHRGLSLEPPPALPAAGAPSLAPGSVNGGRAFAPFPPVSSTPPPATAAPSGAAAGRRRALASHRSLARLLPAVYGVGPAGLPADATPERRAQALQLRAYLLVFDQLLANSQAQLAHAARLLAPLHPRDPHPLDAEGVLAATDRDLPLTDLTELLQGAPASWPEQLRQALRASAPPTAAGQRAALLAHLLRLFGEELSLETRPAAGGGAALATAEALATRLVTARSEFLRRIVPLTAGRGSGPDLLAPAPQLPSPATPPFGADAGQGPCAERIRRKLGLPLAPDGTPPLLVIEHLLLRPLADDSGQRVQGGEDPIPFLSDVARPDPWSGRVSVVINAALLPAMAEAERDRWLARLLRQELPAHLRVELHLLADGSAPAGSGPWSTLLAAWGRFRALLQAHRLAGLGDPGATTSADPLAPLLLSLRLRDSRDQLLSLLRIGLPWPLRAIPLADQILVASGQRGAITLPYSQRGVRYQLVEVASGATVGSCAEGTDGPLTLLTPAIDNDITLRVLASVLPLRPPGAPLDATAVALTASGRARSTLLAGEIRVVEGVDVRLPLRLLDPRFIPLPRLHPDGEALLADHDQRLLVEVEASQEGVVYEVIDASQRDLPFERQTPLSAKVVGTSRAIRLELYASAAEDRDLAVRASLEKRRGRARAEDRRILTTILPLRVRANPAVPLRLLTPVVNAGASTKVAIGAAAGPAAPVSQASVRYLLQARALADADWRFDNPAAASALTTITGPLEGFTPQRSSGPGNGAELSLEQPISGEGMVVAALARKEHRLSPFSATDERTVASEVPLRQAAVAYTRPEAQRRVLLLRDAENPSLWSFWGGQPGVAYTLRPEAERVRTIPLGPSLALREGNDAAGGARGIGRARVERDLVVDATAGTPPAELTADPARVGELRFWAHFLRSGVEVALEHPPILVWAEPPGVCQGESARVVVSRLAPAQRGRLLRDTTLLRDGTADATGNLSLPSGPLPGASRLQLDVGVKCSLWIAQAVTLDLTVRVLDHQPLLAGTPAHLVDWGGGAVVEVATSQANVTYTLINAADRDLPVERQATFCPSLRGTGGPLRLRCDGLREDVDLLVRGTRVYDAAGTQQSTGYLTTIVPLRVRANPAVPLRLLTPVVDAEALASVAIGAAPDAAPAAPVSQASVRYLLHTRPLADADWRFDNPAAEPALTTITGALEGFTPQRASASGNGAVLTLAPSISGEGMVVAALAQKEHRVSPLSATDARTVASAVPLRQAAVAYTRPDAKRRLILRRDDEHRSIWSLWGGQPGVAYTLWPTAERSGGNPMAPPLSITEGSEAPGGLRGIGRARVARDLVIDAVDGTPRAVVHPDPAQLSAPRLWARFHRSGVEVLLEFSPILVWADPPAVGRGDGARVVVSRLQAAQRGRLLRDTTLLRDGSADGAGNLSLPTGPLPGATLLQLDVGARCPVPFAQGVNTDLPVRVRDFHPLLAGAPAHLLDWNGTAVVEVADSQADVTYTLINAADRDLPVERQATFCPSLRGTGGVLDLRCEGLREDVDLLVRGTRVLDAEGQRQCVACLTTIVPLRVRANPAVPLRLLTPVVDAEALASVAIGAPPDAGAGSAAPVSQASVRYLLHTRPLADGDWRFDNPAVEPALTTITGPLEGFTSDPHANGPGTGAVLILAPSISGEGMVVAALAQKEHRVGPLSATDARTVASTVPLRQAAVAYTRPDAHRHLILRRDAHNPSHWTLLGGQPGVAYTLWPTAERGGGATPMGPSLALPERSEAPGGLRGIGRVRVARDLVVESVDGVPRGTFHLDPAHPGEPRLWARFLRSGVEVLLEVPPILEWESPPAEAPMTAVQRVGVRRGRAFRPDPLPEAPPPLAEDVATDLPVRVLAGELLADGSAARLLDWDACIAVEVADSQADVAYTLINAADRDLPPDQQFPFCSSQRGNGGVLNLPCEGLREDVDLLVRGTRLVDDEALWHTTAYLTTTLLLRVRANPAVPLSLVEPLLDPASACELWVGDDALPSQASVTYNAWRLTLKPEDWQGEEAASAGAVPTPRLPSPPPASAPADAGWSGCGEPLAGTDGDVSRGIEGRLRLSLGPAEVDAVLAVVASKWHSPSPLANPEAPGVVSATVLLPLVAQLTRPDPERRLALVADGRGWLLRGGEPGTFYTLRRPSDGATVATPMYVPPRTSEDPPSDWGLGWQRLGRDTVVASAAGPGFDGRPHVTELHRAVVEARRAFSGATNRLRRKPLVVAPLKKGEMASALVYGLAPEERITVRRLGSQAPNQPISRAGTKGDGLVRLDLGSVPADTELTLDVSQEGSDRLWSFTARVLTLGGTAP